MNKVKLYFLKWKNKEDIASNINESYSESEWKYLHISKTCISKFIFLLITSQFLSSSKEFKSVEYWWNQLTCTGNKKNLSISDMIRSM